MSSTTYVETEREESLLQTSAHALSDAAVDARAQAKVAAQNVKAGVGWSVYKAAFGVSFGVVFTGVFLTELLPVESSLRRGLEDGAGAALDAIETRKVTRGELVEEPIHSEGAGGDWTTSEIPGGVTGRPATVARAPRPRTRPA